MFDLVNGRPDDEVLLARLIGPTLVVGFNVDAYRGVLG